MKPVKIKMALIFHPLDPTVTKLLQFRFEALRLRQGKKPKGCKFASVGLVNLTVSNGRTTPERGTPTGQEELAEQVQDDITIPLPKKKQHLVLQKWAKSPPEHPKQELSRAECHLQSSLCEAEPCTCCVGKGTLLLALLPVCRAWMAPWWFAAITLYVWQVLLQKLHH